MKKLHPDTHIAVLKFIEKRNVTIIENIDDIKLLFNPDSLKNNSKPELHIKDNTIIIFDHHNYNIAWMHELFEIVLSRKDNISSFVNLPKGMPEHLQSQLLSQFQNKMNIIEPTVKLYYCNCPKVSEELFKPFFKQLFDNSQISSGTNQKFEYDSPTVMLMMNKNVPEVFMEFEKLFPMDVQKVFSAFVILHDAQKSIDAQNTENQILKQEPPIYKA